MATTYLTRTQGSPTENKKFTVSCWFQASQVADEMKLIYSDDNSTNNYTYIHFSDTSGRIRFQNRNGGSNNTELIWENHIKDFSAFYHLVMAVDSTQTTASDRVKFYLNGVQQTVLDSSANTFPPSDQTFTLNSGGYGVDIGANGFNNNAYFRGVMSYFAFIDGTQELPGIFGETDSTTGQWKIKTTITPSVAWGANGFLILKNGNSLTDESSNSNNFTLGGGTLTKTESCPSNVFATMNRASPTTVSLTNMANGNLYNGDQSPNYWQGIPGTLAASSGKIYWEVKIEGVWGSTSQNSQRHGIANIAAAVDNNTSDAYDIQWTTAAYGIGWCNTSGVRNSGSVTGTSDYSTFIATNVLMFAMDLDNLKLYLGKNGVWENSGDPTSGASGTGAYTIPAAGMWAPYSETKYGSDVISWNCGNGYFRTVAISPAGSPASTPGIFQYQIPTGYQPISTKGLNV